MSSSAPIVVVKQPPAGLVSRSAAASVARRRPSNAAIANGSAAAVQQTQDRLRIIPVSGSDVVDGETRIPSNSPTPTAPAPPTHDGQPSFGPSSPSAAAKPAPPVLRRSSSPTVEPQQMPRARASTPQPQPRTSGLNSPLAAAVAAAMTRSPTPPGQNRGRQSPDIPSVILAPTATATASTPTTNSGSRKNSIVYAERVTDGEHSTPNATALHVAHPPRPASVMVVKRRPTPQPQQRPPPRRPDGAHSAAPPLVSMVQQQLLQQPGRDEGSGAIAADGRRAVTPAGRERLHRTQSYGGVPATVISVPASSTTPCLTGFSRPGNSNLSPAEEDEGRPSHHSPRPPKKKKSQSNRISCGSASRAVEDSQDGLEQKKNRKKKARQSASMSGSASQRNMNSSCSEGPRKTPRQRKSTGTSTTQKATGQTTLASSWDSTGSPSGMRTAATSRTPTLRSPAYATPLSTPKSSQPGSSPRKASKPQQKKPKGRSSPRLATKDATRDADTRHHASTTASSHGRVLSLSATDPAGPFSAGLATPTHVQPPSLYSTPYTTPDAHRTGGRSTGRGAVLSSGTVSPLNSSRGAAGGGREGRIYRGQDATGSPEEATAAGGVQQYTPPAVFTRPSPAPLGASPLSKARRPTLGPVGDDVERGRGGGAGSRRASRGLFSQSDMNSTTNGNNDWIVSNGNSEPPSPGNASRVTVADTSAVWSSRGTVSRGASTGTRAPSVPHLLFTSESLDASPSRSGAHSHHGRRQNDDSDGHDAPGSRRQSASYLSASASHHTVAPLPTASPPTTPSPSKNKRQQQEQQEKRHREQSQQRIRAAASPRFGGATPRTFNSGPITVKGLAYRFDVGRKEWMKQSVTFTVANAARADGRDDLFQYYSVEGRPWMGNGSAAKGSPATVKVLRHDVMGVTAEEDYFAQSACQQVAAYTAACWAERMERRAQSPGKGAAPGGGRNPEMASYRLSDVTPFLQTRRMLVRVDDDSVKEGLEKCKHAGDPNAQRSFFARTTNDSGALLCIVEVGAYCGPAGGGATSETTSSLVQQGKSSAPAAGGVRRASGAAVVEMDAERLAKLSEALGHLSLASCDGTILLAGLREGCCSVGRNAAAPVPGSPLRPAGIGSPPLLSDPIVHSTIKLPHLRSQYGALFGRTNGRQRAMESWARTHLCNEYCYILGIEADKAYALVQRGAKGVGDANKLVAAVKHMYQMMPKRVPRYHAPAATVRGARRASADDATRGIFVDLCGGVMYAFDRHGTMRWQPTKVTVRVNVAEEGKPAEFGCGRKFLRFHARVRCDDAMGDNQSTSSTSSVPSSAAAAAGNGTGFYSPRSAPPPPSFAKMDILVLDSSTAGGQPQGGSAVDESYFRLAGERAILVDLVEHYNSHASRDLVSGSGQSPASPLLVRERAVIRVNRNRLRAIMEASVGAAQAKQLSSAGLLRHVAEDSRDLMLLIEPVDEEGRAVLGANCQTQPPAAAAAELQPALTATTTAVFAPRGSAAGPGSPPSRRTMTPGEASAAAGANRKQKALPTVAAATAPAVGRDAAMSRSDVVESFRRFCASEGGGAVDVAEIELAAAPVVTATATGKLRYGRANRGVTIAWANVKVHEGSSGSGKRSTTALGERLQFFHSRMLQFHIYTALKYAFNFHKFLWQPLETFVLVPTPDTGIAAGTYRVCFEVMELAPSSSSGVRRRYAEESRGYNLQRELAHNSSVSARGVATGRTVEANQTPRGHAADREWSPVGSEDGCSDEDTDADDNASPFCSPSMPKLDFKQPAGSFALPSSSTATAHQRSPSLANVGSCNGSFGANTNPSSSAAVGGLLVSPRMMNQGLPVATEPDGAVEWSSGVAKMFKRNTGIGAPLPISELNYFFEAAKQNYCACVVRDFNTWLATCHACTPRNTTTGSSGGGGGLTSASGGRGSSPALMASSAGGSSDALQSPRQWQYSPVGTSSYPQLWFVPASVITLRFDVDLPEHLCRARKGFFSYRCREMDKKRPDLVEEACAAPTPSPGNARAAGVAPPTLAAIRQAAAAASDGGEAAALNQRMSCVTFTLEPRLDGQFSKYTSNHKDIYYDNEVPLDDRDNEARRQIVQCAAALAHFSYQESDGGMLLCDLQGVGPALTDPEIHTADDGDEDESGEETEAMLSSRGHRSEIQERLFEQTAVFLAGNGGKRGIDLFVQHHRCSEVCTTAGLRPLDVRRPIVRRAGGIGAGAVPRGHSSEGEQERNRYLLFLKGAQMAAEML